MKRILILFILLLPILAMAVLPNESIKTLIGDNELSKLQDKTIIVILEKKKTDRDIIVSIQKYLIKNEIVVTQDIENADYSLIVNSSITKKRAQGQGSNKFASLDLTCISNPDKRVIFVTNCEIPADTIHLKSGLRFKWYEPILFTVAIGSLVFGLWNLN